MRVALRRLTREQWLVLAGAVATLLLSWRALGVTPRSGVDQSWNAALHLAIQQGTAFGPDVIYTYGPLGFLKVPAWWGTTTGAAAIVYETAVRLALFVVVLAVARRSFGWLAALALMLLVGAEVEDAAVPLALGVALWVLLGAREREGAARSRMLALAALGVLGGVELLAKTNTGVVILAVGALAALLGPGAGRARLRLVAALAGTALLTALLGWLASGQSLGDLGAYVVNTASIVAGYSSAMNIEFGPVDWHYTAAIVATVLGALGLWRVTDGRDRRLRAGALAIWAVYAWLAFKQGFVRHDAHVVHFFAALFVGLAAVPWPARARGIALTALVVPLVVLVAIQNQRVGDLVRPVAAVDRAFSDVLPVLSGGERLERVRAGDARVRSEVRVAPPTLALLEGRGVHVAPLEASVVAGHDLRWDPLPVFQDYQAYTPRLDDLNADRLLGPDAPERILFRNGPTLDDRVAIWDPPRQKRALLCRYRPLGPANLEWLVLAPGPDRCGPERRVSSVRAAWGEHVRLPAPSGPGRMVTMRIRGVGVGGLERLRTLAYKAYERQLDVNRGAALQRLIPATAQSGLIVALPDGMDYPGPHALLPEPPRTLAVRRSGHEPGGRPLRFDFFETNVTR